jgi:hypothetical protein
VKAFHVSWDRFPDPAKADDVSLALPRGGQNGACLPLLAPVKPMVASGRGETGGRKGLKILFHEPPTVLR